MKTNGNEPVSPIIESQSVQGNMTMDCTSVGLTKREYFAAKAMQSFIHVLDNNTEIIRAQAEKYNQTVSQYTVDCAVEYADLLIEALNKEATHE